MRAVHHSSAFDGIREAAMRTGSSGSGMGGNGRRLSRPPVRFDIGWVLFIPAALVAISAVARWAL